MNSAFVVYEKLSRSRRVLPASAYGLDVLINNSSYPTQPHSLIAKYPTKAECIDLFIINSK